MSDDTEAELAKLAAALGVDVEALRRYALHDWLQTTALAALLGNLSGATLKRRIEEG